MELEQIAWSHLDLYVLPGQHMRAVELYRNEVVRPALSLLDAKHEEARNSADMAMRAFGADAIEDAHAMTVEGFLLAVQSMFERGLRRMLEAGSNQHSPKLCINNARNIRWNKEMNKGAQALFEKLFGAPIDLFGCYDDLHLLQVLGNALRHGDGPSAKALYELCPSLWLMSLPPGTRIPEIDFTVPDTAPRHPSFDGISLSPELLEQMIQSVLWFWEDVDFVRCNSFTRKDPSVDAHLDKMRQERSQRQAQRTWSPG